MLESILSALAVPVLTALGTAVLSGYVNAKVFDVKMNGMRDRILRTEVEVQKLRDWKHDNEGNMTWVEDSREVERRNRIESDARARRKP